MRGCGVRRSNGVQNRLWWRKTRSSGSRSLPASRRLARAPRARRRGPGAPRHRPSRVASNHQDVLRRGEANADRAGRSCTRRRRGGAAAPRAATRRRRCRRVPATSWRCFRGCAGPVGGAACSERHAQGERGQRANMDIRHVSCSRRARCAKRWCTALRFARCLRRGRVRPGLCG